MRGTVLVTDRTHNSVYVGSNPAPAISWESLTGESHRGMFA